MGEIDGSFTVERSLNECVCPYCNKHIDNVWDLYPALDTLEYGLGTYSENLRLDCPYCDGDIHISVDYAVVKQTFCKRYEEDD